MKYKLKPTMEWMFYDDNEILKKPCKNVKLPLDEEDELAIDKMMSYIDACYDGKSLQYKIRDGIGMTANQIGYNKNLIYIHFDEGKTEHKYLLANAKIIEESSSIQYISNGEGCLSVKEDVEGIVPRKEFIKVMAYDLLNNKDVIINASGLLAICLQHEIDHSNGMLYHDRINKLNPGYFKEEWKKI